jgi:hypothetical protein
MLQGRVDTVLKSKRYIFNTGHPSTVSPGCCTGRNAKGLIVFTTRPSAASAAFSFFRFSELFHLIAEEIQLGTD